MYQYGNCKQVFYHWNQDNADPDSGNDGKIAILMPDTGCKIELDSEELIDTIYGNENEITIKFFNNMGTVIYNPSH